MSRAGDVCGWGIACPLTEIHPLTALEWRHVLAWHPDRVVPGPHGTAALVEAVLAQAGPRPEEAR